MASFGDIFLAEIVANIFYNADKKVRREVISTSNFLEVNERERVAALCSRIRDKISANPFVRSTSIQAHARDTTQRDALFVFRFGEQVKIGLVEAKYLRIHNAVLKDSWDWDDKSKDKNSHFTKQVKSQQQWVRDAAVWDMFIPNCPIGSNHLPLDKYGSSNIWADETNASPKISRPKELWTYQDVLDLKEQYLSLYDIIKAIFRCQRGTFHDITGKSELTIFSNDEKKIMAIPIPRNFYSLRERLQVFFNQHKTIDSYNYYRFDEVANSVSNYVSNKELFVPANVLKKNSFSPESLDEYSKIVRNSYKSINKQL